MIKRDSDEDEPKLSSETLQALQEFYAEQNRGSNSDEETDNVDGEPISENWKLSQFWYDNETTKKLVEIALKNTPSIGGKIALISCPTIYSSLRDAIGEKCQVTLFEFDSRFKCYGADFVPYDYNKPLDLPPHPSGTWSGYFDLVVADPPYLSEECFRKTAITIKHLTTNKILLCTGATMADLAARILRLQITQFEPKHKNNLGNEFCCYANFDIMK